MDDFRYDPPLDPYLVLIHLDRDVAVVNKPSGLLSVPGRGPGLEDSVVARLRRDHAGALDVHRLDLDTSGLLVVALRRKAERHLKQQFAERTVQKMYLARVAGIVEEDSGSIALPLAPHPSEPLRHRVDHETGRPAHTDWKVVSRDPETDSTLLELRPTTGRSHQLRVHLLSLGHPILGDRFYAPPAVVARAPQLCLHAAELAFDHPYSDERLVFRCQPGFR
jgi:tRNA pseudouridine32 synthase / 23S rRNA pseudouridine746 synthase